MEWMDTIRGAAILFVITHHAISALDPHWFGVGAPDWLVRADNAAAPFRMTTLMFLSGMLLSASLRKPAIPFLMGKARRLGWPYLLWSFLLLLLLGQLGRLTVGDVLFHPPTVYWYLWFLLAFYVLALLLRRVPPAILVAIALAASALEPVWGGGARFPYLFAYFMLGHLASASSDQWLPIVQRPLVRAASLIVTVIVATCSAIWDNVQYQAIWSWAVLFGVATAIGWAPTLAGTRVGRELQRVGRNSIVTYVAHWPVICIIGLTLNAHGEFSPTYLLPASLIAGFAIPLGLAKARMRWPAVNILFELPRGRWG